MNLFPLIDIDIAAVIILSIVLRFSYTKFHVKCNQKHFKIFNFLTFFTLLILLLEIVSICLPTYTYASLIPLSILINTLGFMLCPVILLTWTIQLKTWLNLPCHFRFTIIPVAINFLLCLLNINFPIIFSITETNQYMRESLFFLQALASYSYIAYNLFILIRHKKEMATREFSVFLNFIVIPAVASLIQIFSPQTLMIWSSSAIAITLLYIFLQEITLTQDPLTHAQNRLGFETHIAALLGCSQPTFSMISIDLDDFKSINDTYGHLEGDAALITMVKLLESTFRGTGNVFRIGGDEFMVIMPSHNTLLIEQFLARLSENVMTYNTSSHKPYSLKFSYGYEAYSPQYAHFHDYMTHLDRLMYADKEKNKMK